MVKHYDGENLRSEADRLNSSRRMTQAEIAAMAGMSVRTYQRLLEPGVRKINRNVRSLMDVLGISEERILPDTGLRFIDSAEFLSFVLLLLDALRIDVDVFGPPRNEKGPSPDTIQRVKREVDEAANELHDLVRKRRDHDRNHWEDSVHDFWERSIIRKISFCYNFRKYEYVRPLANDEVSGTATKDDSVPITRIMGQIFLISHGFRTQVGELARARDRVEWHRILFPDIYQDYVPLSPDRDVPYVKWEGRVPTDSSR
jgi:transcriptional regulator with XRE-family HTH domain